MGQVSRDGGRRAARRRARLARGIGRTLTLNGARDAVAGLPNAPGVYRFLDGRRRVLYVGRAWRLRSRVGSYWTNLGDRPRLERMVQRIARIEALTCDSEHEAAWLERNLLLRTLPPWNRTSGAEVPVFIRVNAQAALPGLSVVHNVLDPGTGVHFGPYLGGHKVRLAVSALHRALPLAYAGESVTGLGRDLARIRDVGPADRQTLVESITAVLNRESAAVTAVRDRLVALRERATEALAYELAQQVQTEIEAYEWIVAEQKVTSAEPDDYDVYGWASGVLVRFEIRGGCLCAWSTRACTETAARTHTATTPARWANFARRNAELAARLVIRR